MKTNGPTKILKNSKKLFCNKNISDRKIRNTDKKNNKINLSSKK